MKARLPARRMNVIGEIFGSPWWAAVWRALSAVDSRTTMYAAMVGAAIVVGIGVPLAAALNIWLDEAFTLHTTGSGVGYAWIQSIVFETQPPLYFAVEALWRTIDESSIAFARFPSVVYAALAVAVIVYAAHRIAPRVPSIGIAVVTACNPLVIWAAVELRLYALLLLIGAVLTWMLFEAFLVAKPSRTARVCYVVFAIVGLYTQYYIGFVLVAHGVTLLALRRGALRPFAVAMALVALAFAPFAQVAITHVHSSGAYVTRLTYVAVLHRITDAVFVFVLPHELWWHGVVKLAGIAIAAALLGAVFLIGSPSVKQPERGIFVAWVMCIFIFSVLFAISGAPIDTLRHIIVLAPPSLLVTYLLFSSLTRRETMLSFTAAVVFASFAGATLWVRYHPPLLKSGDWQRVADTLAKDDRTTPIAVFPADLTLLLKTYQPELAATPIPKPMPFTLDYDREMTLNDESSVARVLEPIRARSARIWIVSTGRCTSAHIDYDYHCRYLESYMNSRYRVLKSIAFPGALAELYTRLPSPALSESLKHAN